jgi:hypothetical protein
MLYEITVTGRKLLNYQKELADKFHYRELSYYDSLNAMRLYVTSLPEGFKLEHPEIKVAENEEINECNKPGYEVIKKKKFPIVSRDGTLIASTYNRIVIGHYSAFLEMNYDDLYRENIRCKKGQEYRIANPKYSDKVKYLWFTTKDDSCCKLYKQKREVAYADYKIGMWYISPFEVLDLNELKNVFFG